MVTHSRASNALRASMAAVILLISSGCGGTGGSSTAVPTPPQVVVSVSPATLSLATGTTADFSASVTNSANSNVTWTVEESPAGGTITSTGKYTAPAAAGTFHVVATSLAAPTKSAKAVVNVYVPPPTFVSVPPSDASEGTVYAYSVQATDPGGEELSFELSAAPSGATLSGTTLSWTPTFEQSRTEDHFTVVVRTPSGRNASQSWVVAPRGSVHGKMYYRYLSATGVQVEPINFTIASCSIFFKSTDGSLVRHDSVGWADGTFMVPDVPAGHYWFVLWSWAPGWSWDPVWTDTNSLDMSLSFLGRPNVKQDNARLRQYSIAGLIPAGLEDVIEWWVPNVNESSGWAVAPGDTQFESSVLAPHWLDASEGDQAYVMQLVSGKVGGADYRALARTLGPLEITDTIAGPTDVVGNMNDDTRDQGLRANIAISKFSQLIAASRATGSSPGYLSIDAHPYGIGEGFLLDSSGGQHLLNVTLPSTTITPSSDVDLGEILYGNPFPGTWPKVIEYSQNISVSYQLPGTIHPTGIGSVISQATNEFPTAAKPLEPILGAITNLRIDGQDFFQPSTISSSPTLSWDIPEAKTPNGYIIGLWEVSVGANSSTTLSWVQTFRSGTNEVWFPSGTMELQHSYVLLINAVYEGGRDFGSEPFLNGFPRARTCYMSGIITVPAITSTQIAPAALVRGAELNRRLQMRAVRQDNGN